MYESDKQRLSVSVVECKDLKKMDTFGKSDPFMRVLLVPRGHKKMQIKSSRKILIQCLMKFLNVRLVYSVLFMFVLSRISSRFR